MSDQQDETTAGQQLVPFDDFAEEQPRHVWHDGRLYFAIVDVIAYLTGSTAPHQYWRDMKRRMSGEGWAETQAKCLPLKMPAADGKQRLTDAADTETLLRIIQSIPSPKAEPFKQWLARVGAERLEEAENPELAADRMRQLYRARGYSDEWIDRRLQGIVVRDELTQEWRERGAGAAVCHPHRHFEPRYVRTVSRRAQADQDAEGARQSARQHDHHGAAPHGTLRGNSQDAASGA